MTTTTCAYFNAQHWDCGHGASSTCKLLALDSTDANGTNFQFASSTCFTDGVATANGFTYGEVVSTVMLFLIYVVVCAVAFQLHFRRIKIKN